MGHALNSIGVKSSIGVGLACVNETDDVVHEAVDLVVNLESPSFNPNRQLNGAKY